MQQPRSYTENVAALFVFASFDKISAPIQPLQKNPQDDCLSCHLSGGAVGLGIGYFSLRTALQIQQKTTTPSRAVVRLGFTGVSKLLYMYQPSYTNTIHSICFSRNIPSFLLFIMYIYNK